jgi:hypothetical protein
MPVIQELQEFSGAFIDQAKYIRIYYQIGLYIKTHQTNFAIGYLVHEKRTKDTDNFCHGVKNHSG